MNKKIFIKNRPFDINDANDMQNWTEDALKKTMASIYSTGIVEGLNVVPKSGLQLTLNIGKAFNFNYDFINVSAAQTVTIATAHATNPRYDKIVISYLSSTVDNVDTTNVYGMGTSFIYSQNKLDSFQIQVVQGTPASSPVVPATPANSIALAQIYVGAAASTIAANNITDLRQFISINSNINKPLVIIDNTAPTDVNVIWIDTTVNKPKTYVNSKWTILNSGDADTLNGKAASDFATAGHNHDASYYTKAQADSNYAPNNHNHDTVYYTKTQLNTSGGGGQTHWNNVTNKPSTFTPDIHNHDDSYYPKTESDNKYLQKSDNLAALTNKATARNNLGLGTMATESTSGYSPSSHNHDSAYVKGDYSLSVGTTAPVSPTTKSIWWDTSSYLIKRYDGSKWINLNANDALTLNGLTGGTAANNLLKLDSSGKVPSGNLNKASTSGEGIVQLTDSIASTSTTTAATAKAARDAYESALGWARSMGLGSAARDISSTNLNSLDVTGFYMGTNLTNKPPDNTGWYFIINIKHNDLYRKQIAYPFSSVSTYERRQDGGVWTAWRRNLSAGDFIDASDVYATGWVYTDRVVGKANNPIVYFGSNGAPCRIDVTGSSWRLGRDDSNYIRQDADGSMNMIMQGVTRHIFYANGTKSGGSIIVDGENLGMSPIDSPQSLIEYVKLGVKLTPEGTRVDLDPKFVKATAEYGVFPSRGEVTEEHDDYFIIKGTGKAHCRIVGERIDAVGQFWINIVEEEYPIESTEE